MRDNEMEIRDCNEDDYPDCSPSNDVVWDSGNDELF
jgi:hypothetical protein